MIQISRRDSKKKACMIFRCEIYPKGLLHATSMKTGYECDCSVILQQMKKYGIIERDM